jgi:hypothetical protein
MTDERIEKWTGWIEGTIWKNVLTLHLQRDTWRDVSQILQENGELPDSYWWKFMVDTYGVTQGMGVRRQADTHRDAASLGKLLQEVGDDASRITQDFWVDLWHTTDPADLEHARRVFAEAYGGTVATSLDPSIPAVDLDGLRAAAATVKDWVDQHVAHADASPAPTSETLTLSDIHQAVDVIGDLFKKYYLLFTAAEVEVVPIIDPKWKLVFRVPWMRGS